MRSLLYIVIYIVGLAGFSTAFANKAQLPNTIELKLSSPDVSAQSINITTSLRSASKFYKASANLVITRQGSTKGLPIKVFNGDGDIGFDYLSDVKLPVLPPGKYRVHGTFLMFKNKKDPKPLRVGTNLYLDIRRDNKVLSSNLSFAHIKQLELQAKLNKLGYDSKSLKANDLATLKTQNPALFQQLKDVNKVKTIKTDNERTLVANPGSVAMQRKRPALVQTVELSAGQVEAADPRKALSRKSVGLDKQNAVLETQQDEL